MQIQKLKDAIALLNVCTSYVEFKEQVRQTEALSLVVLVASFHSEFTDHIGLAASLVSAMNRFRCPVMYLWVIRCLSKV